MNRVFVLSRTKVPLMPCHPARARKLLRDGKAAVYRRQPFTIVLKNREGGDSQPVEFKTDPGSRTTGIALVGEFEQQGNVVLWGANLEHRGLSVKSAMTDRRMFRTGRRGRKTRYRPARFNNRARPKGWLPPSLRSRVDNIATWYERLIFSAPVSHAAIETVRFDMQLMTNPNIQGAEYQQGELAGYELRNYVMDRGNHKCAYCGAKGVPLEIEHVVPRSSRGSNRVSNLVPSCKPCNQRKGSQPVEVFLKEKPDVLKRIKAQMKTPLHDAAAVNATRYAIGDALKEWGLPVTFWSGGRTKWNRTNQGYEKDHWIDAACVGASGVEVEIPEGARLNIKATGRGNRRVHRNDKFGFPTGAARSAKRVQGFQTGDIVRLDCPKGKFAGIHIGRVCRLHIPNQRVNINTPNGIAGRKPHEFTSLQRADGYEYTTATTD